MFFVKLLDSISGPYSVALDGRWGSGKTFFVKQAKMLLDVYNPFSQLTEWDVESHREKIKPAWDKLTKKHCKESWDPNPQLCVYFDAWEYDSEQDPLTALLYQITKVASNDYSLKSKRNTIDIASSILELISGRNFQKMFHSLKAKNSTNDTQESFELRDKIEQYFTGLLPEHGDRLIIIIDELDRCNPAFAVKLLERIKHYFTHEKITFVFSLNMEQMQHTVRQHYGIGFDAHKYIERFFDLIIPMPKLKRDRFRTLLCPDISRPAFQIADAFAKMNRMEMREITRYYTALNMMTKVTTSPMRDYPSFWFCYHFLFPIALGLQKCDISKYDRFINGDDSSPLIDLLSNETMLNNVLTFFKGLRKLTQNR